jgi:branched-chain amino acid transport system substrate-binding protein
MIRHRACVAAALAASLVLAACSGDDEAAPTSSAAASTSAAPAPDTTSAATEPTTPAEPGEAGFVFGFVRPAAGLLRELSTAQEAALQLAVDDINDAGGVNGAPATIVSVDEPLNGDVAAAVADVIDEGANLVLGPVGSTGAIAALRTLTDRGAIACSASATTPQLTQLDTAGVFFRTAMPDTFTLQAVADQIEADLAAAQLPEGTPYRVAIVARADDYGVNVGNGLASVLLARGIEATVTDYNPRRVVFRNEASRVASLNANSVVTVTYNEAPRLIAELVGAGVPSSSIIALDGAFNPGLGERTFPGAAADIDGLRVIGSTGSNAFLRRLVESDETDQVIFGAQMYDCAMIGALAASATGSSDPAVFGPEFTGVTADGRSCSTYADCLANLEAGDDIDYEGVSGGVRFDGRGDPAEVRVTTGVFAGGELTEAGFRDLNIDDIRQQEALAAAIFISRIQQFLTAIGYYSGPIDGQWSEELTIAVALLQSDLGVEVTGFWNAETDEAVRERFGEITTLLGDSIAGIQQLLTDLGLYSGPIDGTYNAETVAAIRALQRELGVPETGVIDAATLQAAFERGIVIGSGTTTTTTPATTVPPTTAPAPGTTVPPTVPPTTPPPPTVPPTTPPPPTVPPTTAPIDPPEPEEPTVLEMLRADARFSTLVSILEAAGFTGDTEVLGPITLFAPTNDAFAAIDPADLEALAADPEQLLAVLSYHAVEARLTLADLVGLGGTELGTVHGLPVLITVDGSTVVINGARTIAPDQSGRNGVVIPIDTVLSPITPL